MSEEHLSQQPAHYAHEYSTRLVNPEEFINASDPDGDTYYSLPAWINHWLRGPKNIDHLYEDAGPLMGLPKTGSYEELIKLGWTSFPENKRANLGGKLGEMLLAQQLGYFLGHALIPQTQEEGRRTLRLLPTSGLIDNRQTTDLFVLATDERFIPASVDNHPDVEYDLPGFPLVGIQLKSKDTSQKFPDQPMPPDYEDMDRPNLYSDEAMEARRKVVNLLKDFKIPTITLVANYLDTGVPQLVDTLHEAQKRRPPEFKSLPEYAHEMLIASRNTTNPTEADLKMKQTMLAVAQQLERQMADVSGKNLDKAIKEGALTSMQVMARNINLFYTGK